MMKLEKELHELFGPQDFKIKKNKYSNIEVVLSKEAADHVASILHEYDDSHEVDWGRL